MQRSRLLEALEDAVYRSGRWKKWLQAEELDIPFVEIDPERRNWLVQTGSRYIWTDPEVLRERARLYENLTPVLPDANAWVVERIALSMEHYITNFHLFDSMQLLA
jgi:hypothetical protein